MPNFKEDPNSFGSAFTMKGHTHPGPFQKKAPLKQYAPKENINKEEAYAARAGGPTESSPMEQKSKFKNHGVDANASTSGAGPVKPGSNLIQ
tara:strand:- start:282 stop:557 length:276 start_codon:yes stop_codon:yes gene_type:complete